MEIATMATLVRNRTTERLSALLLACALVACSEGYSTNESVLTLSHGMSQEKVLTAMNRLGQQQPSKFKWHYQLLSGCVLEVHARRFLGGRTPQQVAISNAEIQKRNDAETGGYTVSLASQSDQTIQVVVLDNMAEIDASQMVWLLNDLPRFCVVDLKSGPGPHLVIHKS